MGVAASDDHPAQDREQFLALVADGGRLGAGGSAPMCFPDGEFKIGGSDVHLADLHVDGVDAPVSFWMSGRGSGARSAAGAAAAEDSATDSAIEKRRGRSSQHRWW